MRKPDGTLSQTERGDRVTRRHSDDGMDAVVPDIRRDRVRKRPEPGWCVLDRDRLALRELA